MIIGLAGGTGSGKSSIVRSLVARVGERGQLGDDEPAAIDTALLVAQLAECGANGSTASPALSSSRR